MTQSPKKHVRNAALPQYVVEDAFQPSLTGQPGNWCKLEVKRRQERAHHPSPEYPFRGKCVRHLRPEADPASLRGNGEAYCIMVWRCASRISRSRRILITAPLTAECVTAGRSRCSPRLELMVSKKLMHQASLKQRAITSEMPGEISSGIVTGCWMRLAYFRVDFLLSLRCLTGWSCSQRETISGIFGWAKDHPVKLCLQILCTEMMMFNPNTISCLNDNAWSTYIRMQQANKLRSVNSYTHWKSISRFQPLP